MTVQQIKPYLFYHSHCPDGILAASIMLSHFKTLKHMVDPQVFPYNHGDNIDVRELKLAKSFGHRRSRILIEVYFLDILPSVEIVKNVADTGCKVYIMDHHKSAIPIIEQVLDYTNIENHFSGDKSGCGIAWHYCYGATASPGTLSTTTFHGVSSTTAQSGVSPGVSPGVSSGRAPSRRGRVRSRNHVSPGGLLRASPGTSPGTPPVPPKFTMPNPLVEFVQDRDLWNHHYKESNWVLSYLTTYCKASSTDAYVKEFERWAEETGRYTLLTSVDNKAPYLLVNEHGMRCINEGRKIFEEYHKECERIAKNFTVKKLNHPKGIYNVAITECTGRYASAVGNMLAEQQGVDFSVLYEVVTRQNGGNTQCRGIYMTLDNPENPFIYLRARGSQKNDLDLSDIIRWWDADGSTGGGHAKAAGSTSTMNKFITSFC